jgi:predicted  nucleic acid-binding Zn-ribbon protein
MSLTRLQALLAQKQSQLESITPTLNEASKIVDECDRQLQTLGARKRGKPPEEVARIQSTIDQLRAKKAPAKATYEKLSRQSVTLKSDITQIKEQIAKIEKLNLDQAERDKYANPKTTTRNENII